MTQQTTNAGGGNSVNVIDSSISAVGAYSGSVPKADPVSGQMHISLQDALRLAFRFNLGVISHSTAVVQAQGQRTTARSSLLPIVNSAVSEEFERLNLRTQGVESTTFPESATFNFFDVRAARLNQTVFDLVKLENFRAASHNAAATIKAAQNAQDLVVLAVAGAYLQIIATTARITAASAQVETSRAIYVQATDRFQEGLNARIDATRSQVQLQTEEQRLRSLEADLATQKLRFARIIGLALGQQYTVVDEFPYSPAVSLTQDGAMQRAYRSRRDLQAAATALEAATDSLKAAQAERLPNVGVNADFGAAGLRPSHAATGVFSVAATVTIPLYEGGRIRGEIQQATAAVEQRKAELANLRAQVDQDVRQAFIDLSSAADQAAVATSNVALAHDTLSQSRDRFEAGITDSVELVQAEQTVVQADEDYISATYEHNLAKVSLARAVGNADEVLRELLGK